MDNINNAKDLSILIRSKIPLIIIESDEEQRVLALVRRLSQKLHLPLYNWTITSGLIHRDSDAMVEIFNQDLVKPEHVLAEIKSYKESSLFVLCDFHPYLVDAPHIIRLIKEIALGYRYLGHTVIFLSHRLELPDEIKPFSARFEMPMPDAKMLKKIIYEEAMRYKKAFQKHVKSNPRTIEKMIRNLMGLTLSDARRLARKAIFDDGLITESDLPEVKKAKYELLNLDGLVSFEYETSHFSDVGGLENLKRWLKNREKAFLGDGPKNGLDYPKGIMLLGVQGCGKSLAAKAAAGVWGLPLLRLDFGILYNKFFGETEHNLRKALKMAEVMAPCVLLILPLCLRN